MRVWTFYWVSQLGMLAGTIVYVNAGTPARGDRVAAGILSPALIGAFVLLGLFPLVAKKIARSGQGAARLCPLGGEEARGASTATSS